MPREGQQFGKAECRSGDPACDAEVAGCQNHQFFIRTDSDQLSSADFLAAPLDGCDHTIGSLFEPADLPYSLAVDGPQRDLILLLRLRDDYQSIGAPVEFYELRDTSNAESSFALCDYGFRRVVFRLVAEGILEEIGV